MHGPLALERSNCKTRPQDSKDDTAIAPGTAPAPLALETAPGATWCGVCSVGMPLLRLALVIALIGACVGASVGAGAWSGDTAAATAAAAPNAHMLRRLQTVSPSSLNEILGKIKLDVCSIPGACFRWPTTMPDTPGHYFIVLGSKVDVSYWNIYCDSLKVGRISFSTRQLSDRTVQLLVSLEDIEIKCGLPPNGPI